MHQPIFFFRPKGKKNNNQKYLFVCVFNVFKMDNHMIHIEFIVHHHHDHHPIKRSDPSFQLCILLLSVFNDDDHDDDNQKKKTSSKGV